MLSILLIPCTNIKISLWKYDRNNIKLRKNAFKHNFPNNNSIEYANCVILPLICIIEFFKMFL